MYCDVIVESIFAPPEEFSLKYKETNKDKKKNIPKLFDKIIFFSMFVIIDNYTISLSYIINK